MKVALRGAKVRKELDVLLNSGESMLNLFSAVFSNAIIECHPSQKDLSVDFFPVPVFMDMQVFYNSLSWYSGTSGWKEPPSAFEANLLQL